MERENLLPENQMRGSYWKSNDNHPDTNATTEFESE